MDLGTIGSMGVLGTEVSSKGGAVSGITESSKGGVALGTTEYPRKEEWSQEGVRPFSALGRCSDFLLGPAGTSSLLLV